MNSIWPRSAAAWLATFSVALFAGCASDRHIEAPDEPGPAASRASITRLLPPNIADRTGWAGDISEAFAALEIAPTPENICSVIAITEQESSFRTDPSVPGLPAIAWKEIDKQAERMGVPRLVVRTALHLSSPTGKSYSERIDAVKTEKELSEIFEDFIGIVPLGKTFFADRNPVRTGGPMQVGIAFAEAHAAEKTYPYPVAGTIRHEVFTRRGGTYFGIAHLLDYPASYDKHLYRFADFNAGHYASRNAAFQNAVSKLSGIPLELDGDLVRHGSDAEKEPGRTESATRALAERLDMSDAAIRRDLERGATQEFERTRLFERVFSLADKLRGGAIPRAVLPRIRLQSPKITSKLTTGWFANRVDERRKRCLMRGGSKTEWPSRGRIKKVALSSPGLRSKRSAELIKSRVLETPWPNSNQCLHCNQCIQRGIKMASITIRNLDEQTKARLRVRAAHHGRSMEDEARHILRQSVASGDAARRNLTDSIRERFQTIGGVELQLPVREPMREPPKPAK